MTREPITAYRSISTPAVDIEAYAPLVKRIAYHLQARLPDSILLDDLVQAGMVGLLEAAAKFDGGKGASFETYAGIRIRGAMLDEMRRGDWAPRSVHRNARVIADAIRVVEGRTGRAAQDAEVAAELGVPLPEYHVMLQDAFSTRLFSYEELDEQDDPITEAGTGETERHVEQAEFRSELIDAIKTLSEREQLILSLYYDEEMNLKEIGAVLGVSESRISQIMSQTTMRLRARVQRWVE